MDKRKMVIASMLFLTAVCLLNGQPNKNGVPIVTNYEHAITGGSEQNWCITQDQRGVLYVGNNDKGVLEYDGVEWRQIPLPYDRMVRSIVCGDDGVIYVGAEAEFGFLAPDERGRMQFRSLADTLDPSSFSAIWATYYHDGSVYFCAFNQIFIYHPEDEHISIRSTGEYSFYSFMVDGRLYVSDYADGLMAYGGNDLQVVKGGSFFKEMTITGMASYDENRVLVGTYYNGPYLLDTITGTVDDSFMDSGLKDYLTDGNITSVMPLQEEFVISTMNSGVVILNRDGQASEIITENEELIDDQVPSTYYNEKMEGSGPLWIANFMGISKLETLNPFRVFTETSGFEGFITDIKVFRDQLFISTFEGLYYKSSSSTETTFTRVPVTGGEIITQLFIFRPSSRREFLLAASERGVYVIDTRMNISMLEDGVINPPTDLSDRGEYSGRFLVQDPNNRERIYTGLSQVVGLEYSRGHWEEVMRFSDLPEGEVLAKRCIDKYGYFWSSTASMVTKIDIQHPHHAKPKFFTQEKGLPSDDNNYVFLNPENGEVLLGTRNGFYNYNYFRDTIVRDTFYNKILPPGENQIMAFHRDHDGDFWVSFENAQGDWTELVFSIIEDRPRVIQERSFQRLANTSTDVFYSDPDGNVWFGKSNKLYHFNKQYERKDTARFSALIREVSIGGDSLIFGGSNFIKSGPDRFMLSKHQEKENRPVVINKLNNIRFSWAAPYFEQEEEMEFSYRLDGFNKEWSDWSGITFKEFTTLHSGSYTMAVRARNIYGDESRIASWSFSVGRPWYASVMAFVTYLLLAILLVYIIIKIYTRRLIQENIRLEAIIEERTARIRKQKEELTDSIEYASRIQHALLPSVKLLEENRIEHFILFKPRDIVSGDFYWIGSMKKKLVVVAADCTGHGVPGAFMSMLGMTFLDEIVIKSKISSTGEILEHLRENVITSLKQSGQVTDDSTKDGMDLSMITIDLESREFQYSGAYNPIYLVRKLKRNEKTKLGRGESLDLPRGAVHDEQHLLLQIRADQMPIGISEKKSPFSETSFKNEGYNIYMFTDGYVDQFGGPKNKKFMSRNFKKLILDLQSIPIKDQADAMDKTLKSWMGAGDQIDDILVIGLRIK